MLDRHLRRSLLYVPASNIRAIEKARTLPCDGIILDLEDSVAPEAKDAAREAAVRCVREGDFGGRELIVRVNGIATPWGQSDLTALSKAGPDAILAPKINDAADIRRYDALLAGFPPHTRLWTMVETARCIFRLDEIAAQMSQTRLSCWVMGTNDLAKEMHVELSVMREPLQPALALSVLAARAHGLDIIDGVFNELENAAGFDAQCRQAAAFGFDGKTLIHPNQLDLCNKIFTPSEEMLSKAHTIVGAFDLPETQGRGAIRVNSEMVERLHLERARRIIAIRAVIDAGTQAAGRQGPTDTSVPPASSARQS
jgi:citrate lyase subunit beta/citryl-CoA lyase